MNLKGLWIDNLMVSLGEEIGWRGGREVGFEPSLLPWQHLAVK